MKQLAKAVIEVMKEVKGIEKDLTVGSGQNSYKGVGDQQVKKAVGDSMQKHGLCILPIGVETSVHIDRWEETTQYQNNPPVTKMKQSILTEARTKYLLLHESGESIELAGYGHGVDNQDKGAGKATTYALKYALLYTFMIPTGKIDDADNDHSDEKPVPPKVNKKPENLLIEYTGAIAKEIDDCTTAEQVSAVWVKYIPLQKNPEFIKDIKNKGEFLKLPAATA